MTDIGPGTRLECIDDSPQKNGQPCYLVRGREYVVERVYKPAELTGKWGDIRLGLSGEGGAYCWMAWRSSGQDHMQNVRNELLRVQDEWRKECKIDD